MATIAILIRVKHVSIPAILLTLFSAHAFSEESLKNIDIYLKNPSYRDGEIATHDGGIISTDELRIQALNITYLNKVTDEGKLQKIEAEGQLLIEYGGHFFVGSYISYDFTTKEGLILNGKTQFDIWYIEGECIELHADQSASVQNAQITSCENDEGEWDVHVKRLKLQKNEILTAKDVSFRVFKVPIFWLPALKSNLSLFADPPIRYKITWDKGQGPRLTMRYRFYSSETWNLFLRFDGRTKRGFGGSLEGEYQSLDKRTTFLSKNYLAHDTFYNDNDPNKKRTRFRLQGLHESATEEGNWQSFLTWDKISDKNMPGDFKSDDFEINTARRTQWLVRHIEDRHIAGLNVRARINSFQGFKQELPTLKVSLRPFEIGSTGIISENQTRSAYLDYVYSDDVKSLIQDFHSARLETSHTLYRPLDLNIATFTPYAGFDAIFYNNNPAHHSIGQFMFLYGGDLILPMQRRFKTVTHLFRPYVAFQGISKPTFSPDQVLIFDINDGYNRLNLLKAGIANYWLVRDQESTPFFSADIYGLGFFSDTTFSKRFPKAYADLEYHLSAMAFFANIGWNFQEQTLDRANIRLLWTLNSDFAVSFEFRHRSRFDWRKDDHTNYLVDVTRPIEELLHSPLSDGRNTFLAKAQLQLAPGWTLRFQSHSGWGRAKEPGYTETNVDLITMVSSAWKLRLSYMHTVRTDQVTFGLSFAKS